MSAPVFGLPGDDPPAGEAPTFAPSSDAPAATAPPAPSAAPSSAAPSSAAPAPAPPTSSAAPPPTTAASIISSVVASMPAPSPPPVQPSSQPPMMNMPAFTFPGMAATPAQTDVLAFSGNKNPQLPYIQSDFLYIKSWMLVHKLSPNSWLYSYILWGIVSGFFLICAIMHQFGLRKGWIGAHFSKRFLKKQTFRKQGELAAAKKSGKKHKQPWSLPSYAQMLTLAALVIISILLCLVGPDYVKPTAPLQAHYSQLRRRVHETMVPDGVAPAQYTIPKAWWTFGGRTGLIAFALFPLIIALGLKYPPFAPFAWKYSTEYYFDKLVRLHRWGGRLLYGITCAHVLGYAIQAAIDIRNPAANGLPADHRSVWHFVLLHLPFRYAVAAFTFFTLLMISSLPYVRTNHYEVFYAMHLLTIPGTLIFSALHHAPLAWWCWSALILWLLERTARAVRWLLINTAIGARLPRYKQAKGDTWGRLEESRWETTPMNRNLDEKHPITDSPMEIRKGSGEKGSLTHMRMMSNASTHTLPRADPHFDQSEKPPPGYAHAMLMPGRTVKLRILTRGPFSWAPGQHVLVNIPTISRWTTHPFTVASICDTEAGGDQEIVVFIRAKAGFTKALWDTVAGQVVARSHNDNSDVPKGLKPPRRGAFLPANIDGPFGSSVRERWGNHSTAIIFAGGSGVSFAVAMMEYLCMCLAGRDGQSLGGRPGGRGDSRFKVERVRFVWMVREFAHLSWCSSTIRRCLDMVPRPYLEVSLFVSNFQSKPKSQSMPSPMPSDPRTPTQATMNMDRTSMSMMSMDRGSMMERGSMDALLPPRPMRGGRHGGGDLSDDEGNDSDTSSIGPRSSIYMDNAEGLGHEEHILDLTNFDGDNDARIPGEESLSRRLREEGKVRRARTRKMHAERRRTGGVDSSGAPRTMVQPPTDSEGEDDHARPAHPRASSGGYFAPGADRSPSPAPGGDFGLRPPMHARPASVASFNDDDDAASVRGLRFDIEDKEADDLAVISELAVAGKPKFEKIVAEEAEISRGSICVGCCGPVALNSKIRNVVAKQIDPDKVRRGDMRGMLHLVSEDFEY